MPPQFSWVDQRLIRDNRLGGCSPAAWALYLFLVTVADAEGLSYYAEGSVQRRLGISLDQLLAARAELLRSELIAYETPFYQVLGLERPVVIPAAIRGVRSEEAVSIGEVLRTLAGGGR